MWEGDPVGVDQKRPLVGFALVAVLCAVLMALSVGRGWSVDLFHPGKPIAAPESLGRVDREQPAHADEPHVVVIPAELAPQPFAAVAPHAGGKGASVSRSEDRDRDGSETAAEETEGLAGDDSTTQTQTVPQAETETGSKAARQAEKAAARLERLAEQAAEQAAEKAAEKAARLAEAAAQAAAQAATQSPTQAGGDTAAQAEQAAEVAAAQAAHLADQLLRQAAPTAG